MKQSEIAKKIGISKSYLSMILSGQRNASPELAAKLSSQKLVNFEAKTLSYTQEVTGSSPVPPTIFLDNLASKSPQRNYRRSS